MIGYVTFIQDLDTTKMAIVQTINALSSATDMFKLK